MHKIIIKLRKEFDLKQSDLSDRTGISRNTISKFESGGDIKVSTLVKIVQALGCELIIRKEWKQ